MHDEDDYVARFFSDPSYRKQASLKLADCLTEPEQMQALLGVLDESEEMATILLSYDGGGLLPTHSLLMHTPCSVATNRWLHSPSIYAPQVRE